MVCVEASACQIPSAPTSSVTWIPMIIARRRTRGRAVTRLLSRSAAASWRERSRGGRSAGIGKGDLFAQTGPDLFVQLDEPRLEPHLAHPARSRQIDRELLLH